MKPYTKNKYEHPEMTLVEVALHGHLLTGSTTSNMNVSYGEEDLSREFDNYTFNEEDWL